MRPVTDAEKEAVRVVQRACHVPETGLLDPPTVSAIRGIQGLFNLPMHGYLDTKTAWAIDSIRWTQ